MMGLFIILVLVLFLPFTVQKVERNLEVFLFIMGLAAATVSGIMDENLMKKALVDPIKITIAVLVAGLLTKWLHVQLERSIQALSRALSPRIFAGLTVMVLGLFSSLITAIIAAIILVIIVNGLPLNRQSRVRFTILACFSIGLGAALTPIGEPLSTITVGKLNQDFFYLIKLIGPEVITAIVVFGILTMFFVNPRKNAKGLDVDQQPESYKQIFFRSVKIYLFVMGLTFLGNGFEPFITTYILDLHPTILYWINMISAVLDNATLAAAEISPAMEADTIQAILLGLLISGGMLIPGNIPNIIAAGKLNITSKEWAQFAVPLGLNTMAIYFLVLFVFY
jgi:predicted cation transporter